MALCARGCPEAGSAWVAHTGLVQRIGQVLCRMQIFFGTLFRVMQLLGHQESVGGDAQTGVVMKAAPAPALIVPQTQLLFEVLVVALDAPAHLGLKHHALQWYVLCQRGQPALHRLLVALGPFDERPRLGAPVLARLIAVGSTHAKTGKPRAQREVGALAPLQRVPRRGRQAERHLLETEGPLEALCAQALTVGHGASSAVGQWGVAVHARAATP